jgi:hypothetical protein
MQVYELMSHGREVECERMEILIAAEAVRRGKRKRENNSHRGIAWYLCSNRLTRKYSSGLRCALYES